MKSFNRRERKERREEPANICRGGGVIRITEHFAIFIWSAPHRTNADIEECAKMAAQNVCRKTKLFG
jgi:hypothetical protein